MNKCRIYVDKFDLDNIPRGEKKRAESECGMKVLAFACKDAYGTDIRTLAIEHGSHGKPYFPDRPALHFNISHSGNYAAAAVCGYPVGVDVQVVRSVRENVIEKLCRGAELEYLSGFKNDSERARAFIRLWALKESYVKAIGLGMSFPMDKITFDIRAFDPDRPLSGRLSDSEGIFCLRDCGDFVLAACVLEKGSEKKGESCI